MKETGRPVEGTEFALALAVRVREIKKRVNADLVAPPNEGQRLTRRQFAERIQLSEEALADRLRLSSPTLFSAEQLALICKVFEVRPEYLLLGQGPMMRADVVARDSLVPFATMFHEHITAVLDVAMDVDAEWVASYLPDAEALLQTVEHAVRDVVADCVQAKVTDHRQVNLLVRRAVVARARTQAKVPDVPDGIFKTLANGFSDGSIVDLGAPEPPPSPRDPTKRPIEALKPFSELTDPDSRRLGWSIFNHETGEVRPLLSADHYRAIERITLDDAVPEGIQTLFNTARNVLVYSWHVYRFTVVAELQAYSALEYALRDRLGIGGNSDGPGLAKLLKRAAREGVLSNDTFADLRSNAHHPVITGNSIIDANVDPLVVEKRGHIAVLAEALPMLRNTLAHGSSSVWPDALSTFRLVAVAINWMYANRAD